MPKMSHEYNDNGDNTDCNLLITYHVPRPLQTQLVFTMCFKIGGIILILQAMKQGQWMQMTFLRSWEVILNKEE